MSPTAAAVLLLPPGVHQAAARVLAAAPADPTTGFLTYGPLGLMVAGFLTGLIVPGPTHKRVVEENQRLRELIDGMVWPTIESSKAATTEATKMLGVLERLMEQQDPPPRPRRRTT